MHLTLTLPSGAALTISRRSTLVQLEVLVNVADELKRAGEPDGAQHEEEDVARQRCEAKELHRLRAGETRPCSLRAGSTLASRSQIHC